MIYAFILLSLVAVFTWSAWSGLDAPAMNMPDIRAKIVQIFEDAQDKLTGAVKEKAREELHQAIDEHLE